MCRADQTTAATTRRPNNNKPLRVLLSLDSFEYGSGEKPSFASCALTATLFLSFLFGMEHAGRWYLDSVQDMHPVLENETHRHILARHVMVDALSCAICAVCGWLHRDLLRNVVQAVVYRRAGSMPAAGHEQRMYTYHPAAFRVCLLFFIYQLKNLYDTIVWNDGPEFIFHHVFSLITAWGAMSAGTGFMYTIFYFGISEISTAVLCVLANFDDEHGVPGLGEALPMTKVAIGASFVVLFILCRCIMWPICSWYFCRDVLLALKGKDPRTPSRRGWLKFYLVSLSGMSVLQVAWLGQIFMIAQDELAKVGLL